MMKRIAASVVTAVSCVYFFKDRLVLLRNIAIGGGLVFSAIVGLAAFFQRKLLYVPELPDMPSDYIYYPDHPEFGLKYKDVELKAQDGEVLHAWLIDGRKTSNASNLKPVVLFFQENAGNISFRLPIIKILVNQVGCSVLMLSYRGYGQSKGSPTQAGLQQDAQAALDYILNSDPELELDKSRIMVMGKSLGGAVTLHLAVQNQDKVRAIMVENTFTSVMNMVPKVVPFLAPLIGDKKPLNFLVWDKWINEEKIQQFKPDFPILMFSSKYDELVPSKQMERLKQVCSSRNVHWVDFKRAGHMDAYETESVQYWQGFKKFYDQYML
eukprot:TRINITY_DN79295_c0_g1_i2.p1 TRINITY_DN79295_c0_g1~~TRINITY_DN79295_c0_g1_i2.p1  ORF type:complete len:325 (-),score=35.53 TRINITY_DN79295_c0_g1_i2:263-1237(-)